MKPVRVAAGIIGVLILVIIGGGISAILAYIDGDASILSSLGNLIADSFDFSWILGVIIIMLVVLFFSMIYTGLRSGGSKK